jgi:glycosyl transferase family 25
MELIEKVVYINLERRKDRLEQIQKELSIFPPEKVQRFNAISHEKGAIGCFMSHIAVLEMAISQNWKNVLIVEDDMQWSNFSQTIELLNKLLSQPYDVIGLGGTFVKYNKDTYKASFFSTATAYVISNHYYSVLLQNFKQGCKNLIENYSPQLFALDRYWKQIQARDNWYIVMPPICIQRPSYSDIEKKDVDYTSIFTNPEQQQKRNPLLKFLRRQ